MAVQSRHYDFARGKYFLDAIRSSGYKNAAMALGELVDNSLQAEARNIDILVTERRVLAEERHVRRIQRIAVLDDGEGMEPTLLRRALKLGDGTHFEDDGGIGKFGVGLPQASVSQAKRIDVWSWQDGIENAKHTYIDLNDEDWVDSMVIPKPDSEPIPDPWREMADFDEESGTLVVWSDVDRCTWKRARTLYRHSQNLIGRMYRNWLNPKVNTKLDANITLRLWNENSDEIEREWDFEPNDPLYLTEGTTVTDLLPDHCPDPPFEPYGEKLVRRYEVQREDGEATEHEVELLFSIARQEARKPVDGQHAGAVPHGKHAKSNTGLSVVREGRELELDQGWSSKDPRNRWWGAQVEFGRGMDEIFGVTNNKQHADRLSSMAGKTWEDFAEGDETRQQTKERLKREDFPTFVCLDIASEIKNRIGVLLGKVEDLGEEIKKGKEKEKRHEDSPERKGTEVTEERKEKLGEKGQSDQDEDLEPSEKEEEIRQRLEDQGVPDSQIDQVVGEVADLGLKYSFVDRPLDSSAFFSVEPTAGAIVIALNSSHDAYDRLFASLDDTELEDLSKEELIARLSGANDALKLMLEAWARLEDEAEGDEIYVYKDARNDWGRIARDFLRYEKSG